MYVGCVLGVYKAHGDMKGNMKCVMCVWKGVVGCTAHDMCVPSMYTCFTHSHTPRNPPRSFPPVISFSHAHIPQEGATASLQRALRVLPKDGALWEGLGVAFERLQRFSAAHKVGYCNVFWGLRVVQGCVLGFVELCARIVVHMRDGNRERRFGCVAEHGKTHASHARIRHTT